MSVGDNLVNLLNPMKKPHPASPPLREATPAVKITHRIRGHPKRTTRKWNPPFFLRASGLWRPLHSVPFLHFLDVWREERGKFMGLSLFLSLSHFSYFKQRGCIMPVPTPVTHSRMHLAEPSVAGREKKMEFNIFLKKIKWVQCE